MASNQINFQASVQQPNNQAPTLALPNLYSDGDLLLMEFSQLSNQINKMEENLHLQNLQTVNAITNEHTKQRMLIHNYVSKLLGSIHKKEKELAKKNLELQKCIAWQLRALEAEATVVNLSHQLEMNEKSHQMMISNEPDAGSSCTGDDFMKDMVNCQMCGKELSCVLIFPCKHLCCCKPCEAYVYSCPVCETVKESSLEVSWPQMKKQGEN